MEISATELCSLFLCWQGVDQEPPGVRGVEVYPARVVAEAVQLALDKVIAKCKDLRRAEIGGRHDFWNAGRANGLLWTIEHKCAEILRESKE